MESYNIIFHVNELDKWSMTLANVSNLLIDLADKDVEVIVLANGAAVRYYKTESTEADIEKLTALSEKGVHFTACNNSLKAQNLNKEVLHPFVNIVPAGITELVRKQHEGYAYIKP